MGSRSRRRTSRLAQQGWCPVESYWPSLYAKMLKSNDIAELIAKPSGGGGGGGAVAAAGGAAPGADGAAGAAAAEEEEEEEEEEAAVGGGLFGDEGDDY